MYAHNWHIIDEMLKLTYIHLKRMNLCWLWMNQNNNIKGNHGDNNDMILKIFQKGPYWGSKEIYIGLILGE